MIHPSLVIVPALMSLALLVGTLSIGRARNKR